MKSLKELQREWYAKLADSGFEDIEDERGFLRSSLSDRTKPHTPGTEGPSRLQKQSQAEYYRLASQFLYSYDGFSEFERGVWEKHCEGGTVASIARQHSVGLQSIRTVIKRLRKKFNL